MSTFETIGKVAKKIGQGVTSAGSKLISAKVPESINWIYGLGFKVGLFLLLKVFLIVRYLYSNLSDQGFLMLISQAILGLVLVCAGAILQNPNHYNNPIKLKNTSRLYLLSTIMPIVCVTLSITDNWKLFKAPIQTNLFSNAFSSFKEFNASILFIDKDIMIFFALLLYIISLFYLIANFGFGSIVGRYKQETIDGETVIRTSKSQLLLSIVTLLIFVGFVFLTPTIVHIGKVQIPYSSDTITKYPYSEVMEKLKEIKLDDNITTIVENKGLINKEEEIKSVTINDVDSFEENTWVKKGDPITITIYKKYNKFPSEDLIVINQEKNIPLPIEGSDISWSTSDDSIVTVDNGTIKGISEGEANVCVTVDGLTYNSKITVVEKTTLEKVSDAFKSGKEDISNVLSSGIDKVEDIAKDTFDKASDAGGDVIDSIKDFATQTGTSISEFFDNLTK